MARQGSTGSCSLVDLAFWCLPLTSGHRWDIMDATYGRDDMVFHEFYH